MNRWKECDILTKTPACALNILLHELEFSTVTPFMAFASSINLGDLSKLNFLPFVWYSSN